MNAPVKSTPNFGEATRRFCEAGIPEYALIPVTPRDAEISGTGRLNPKSLGKAPGRFIPHERAWRGLTGDHLTEGVSPKDAREWREWPTPNVGITARFYPAIDSDVESEAAAKAVERALQRTFGGDADYIAERTRAGSPRRLYAFASRNPDDPAARVRYRKFQFRLPADPADAKPHGVDILGYGRQFVAKGIHPSGGMYDWCSDFDLCELVRDDQLLTADDADMVRFLDVLADEIEAADGEVLSASSGVSGGTGELRDYSGADPVMPAEAVFQGLERVPNTQAIFPSRESLVSILAKIRAALGCEAEPNRHRIEDWVTRNGWADADYFNDVWDSLDRGVRQENRNALELLFRDHRIFPTAGDDFPPLTQSEKDGIAEANKTAADAADALLDEFAKSYVVGQVNYATDDKNPMLRRRKEPNRSENMKEWWQLRTGDLNIQLVQKLRTCGRYTQDEHGMWVFIRELEKRRPDATFSGLIRHPHYDRGETVVEENPDGSKTRKLNLRCLSPAIRCAQKPPRNPKQAAADLKTLLQLQDLIFGNDADYERDLLAHMAQTEKRPGSFLYLVGEQGVGKSLYVSMVRMLFDGPNGGKGAIDGTKVANDSSRRFAFGNVEGCRCVAIQELPDNLSAKAQAEIISLFKQRVDIGPDGDYVQTERKYENTEPTLNFARYFVTTNYETALPIEPNDRRAFYVRCVVTTETRPPEAFYEEVAAIMQDPERLATLWRYLCTRDWSNYNPAKAPPLSNGKKEAQIRAMQIPVERYTAAALEHLIDHGRVMFDLQELERLISDMGENECRNTGGVGDRERYDFHHNPRGPEQAALRYIRARAFKPGDYKTPDGKKRLSPIYVFKKAEAAGRLSVANREDVLEALEHDRRQHRLTKRHPLRDYAYPIGLEDDRDSR